MSDLLTTAAGYATNFLAQARARSVTPSTNDLQALSNLRQPLPETINPAEIVLAELDQFGSPATVLTTSGRYFGFVVGGALPVTVGASWLATAWDQNAQVFATSPVAAVTEEVAAGWVLDVLRLPAEASVGFVTGGQMANFTALCVARNAVLAAAGWDFDVNGLFGAPPINVFMSECAHSTVLSAARMIGIGEAQLRRVPADAEGRMDVDALSAALDSYPGPNIVCAQAGNVNTGAFEAFDAIADAAARYGAWLHIDGAFGLWAAASPRFARLTVGHYRADSWTVDAHKWLNTPYDCGMVIVRDPRWHRSLKTARCAYAGPGAEGERDGSTWVPENSRRARGVECWAALRHLGREGVAALVDRCCAHATRFADGLRACGYVVLNEVVLNQVVFTAGSDAATRAALAEIQASGVTWLGPTVWRSQAAMRISVSSWATTDEDVERSLAVLVAARDAINRRSQASLGSSHWGPSVKTEQL